MGDDHSGSSQEHQLDLREYDAGTTELDNTHPQIAAILADVQHRLTKQCTHTEAIRTQLGELQQQLQEFQQRESRQWTKIGLATVGGTALFGGFALTCLPQEVATMAGCGLLTAGGLAFVCGLLRLMQN